MAKFQCQWRSPYGTSNINHFIKQQQTCCCFLGRASITELTEREAAPDKKRDSTEKESTIGIGKDYQRGGIRRSKMQSLGPRKRKEVLGGRIFKCSENKGFH